MSNSRTGICERWRPVLHILGVPEGEALLVGMQNSGIDERDQKRTDVMIMILYSAIITLEILTCAVRQEKEDALI